MFRISLNPLSSLRTITQTKPGNVSAYLKNRQLRRRVCALLLVPVWVFVLMYVFALDLTAQVSIVRVTKDQTTINATTEVTCMRKNARPPVVVPMSLQVGDKLVSDSRLVKVRFNCSGADYIATAPFRVSVEKQQGPGCYLGYSSSGGKLNAISHNVPTHVQAGVAGMASKRTIYQISTGQDLRSGLPRVLPFLFPPQITQEFLVFEGEVDLKLPGFAQTITQGRKAVVAFGNRAPVIEPITKADIEGAANVYAEMDVSQMPTSDPQKRSDAFAKLKDLHAAFLSDPKNLQFQVNLEQQRKSLGIPAEPIQGSPDPQPGPNDLNLRTPAKVKFVKIHNVRNRCQKTHTFRVTPQNQSFAYHPPSLEVTVVSGSSTDVRIEFDAPGMKPGDYRNELLIECLDCKTEKRCRPTSETVPFNVRLR